MFKKLDSYILSEFWLPLASACGLITGVWLGIDKFKVVFKLLARSGASLDKGFVIIGLELPEILATTIPICVLWASFLTFQKLSSQSELLAMRAAGASYLRIMRPAAFLGIIAMCSTFFINEFVVPVTSPLAKQTYTLALYNDPMPEKLDGNFSYFERDEKGVLSRIFFVDTIKGESLRDIIILDVSEKEIAQIHTARRGSWSPERGGWQLRDGTSHLMKREGKNEDYSSQDIVSDFQSTFVPSSINPEKILQKINKVQDMNFLNLAKYINLHDEGNIETSKINDFKTKFHKKFSYPVACILLALTGASLGISGRRKLVSWGYITLGLVVFAFYMSQTMFDSFGESGKILPFITAWIPNVILSAIAGAAVWYRAEH